MVRNFKSFNSSIIIINIIIIFIQKWIKTSKYRSNRYKIIYFRSVFACFNPFSGVHKQVPINISSVTKNCLSIKVDSKMKLFKISAAILAVTAETMVILFIFLMATNHEFLGKSSRCSIFA